METFQTMNISSSAPLKFTPMVETLDNYTSYEYITNFGSHLPLVSLEYFHVMELYGVCRVNNKLTFFG